MNIKHTTRLQQGVGSGRNPGTSQHEKKNLIPGVTVNLESNRITKEVPLRKMKPQSFNHMIDGRAAFDGNAAVCAPMMPSAPPTIHRRHATGRQQGCASNQCTNMVIVYYSFKK